MDGRHAIKSNQGNKCWGINDKLHSAPHIRQSSILKVKSTDRVGRATNIICNGAGWKRKIKLIPWTSCNPKTMLGFEGIINNWCLLYGGCKGSSEYHKTPVSGATTEDQVRSASTAVREHACSKFSVKKMPVEGGETWKPGAPVYSHGYWTIPKMTGNLRYEDGLAHRCITWNSDGLRTLIL